MLESDTGGPFCLHPCPGLHRHECRLFTAPHNHLRLSSKLPFAHDAKPYACCQVANLRMAHLSRADAEEFYAVHAGAPFFDKVRGQRCSYPRPNPATPLQPTLAPCPRQAVPMSKWLKLYCYEVGTPAHAAPLHITTINIFCYLLTNVQQSKPSVFSATMSSSLSAS